MNPVLEEQIDCPYCRIRNDSFWASERGFTAVRCNGCGLIYVNPRPKQDSIDMAVKTGIHGEAAEYLDARARRINAKVSRYRAILQRTFADVWGRGEPISWLDIGAGYGEIVEAVSKLAPVGSIVSGVEPMQPKAVQAQARGLSVAASYLDSTHPQVGFISMVDVFSHIPSFSNFLTTVRSVLKPGGELFVETGNLADLEHREDFPGELGLPDHLVFAGEPQLCGYLQEAGFEIVAIERERIDGLMFSAKNIVKSLLGRPVVKQLPYSSKFRQLMVRARLTASIR